jgi:hypothetical protein
MPSQDHVVSFPKGYPVRFRKFVEGLPKSLVGRRGKIVSEVKTSDRQCWDVMFPGWTIPKPLYLGEFICIPDQVVIRDRNNMWVVRKPKSHQQYYFCPDNACDLFFKPVGLVCSQKCPMQDVQRKGIWCEQCGNMLILEGNHCDFRRVDCPCGASWFSTMSCLSQLVRHE